MNKSRALRLTTAGILLLSVGAILLPRATSYVSTSAVVNAPLITIRSPFDGRIAQASPGVARIVEAGRSVVTIDGERASRSLLSELRARRDAVASELTALEAEERTLEELERALKARETRHRSHGLRRQAAQSRELHAEIRAAQAETAEVARRLDRTRLLLEKGGATPATVEREEAELTARQAEVERLRARRDAQALDRVALQNGITISSITGDDTYARQRQDEVAIRRADLATQAARVRAELGALEVRVADARIELAERERFEATAASTGVVWRASAAAGSKVLAGEEIAKLIDCERRFVEVAVSEAHFESIVPGSPATVRLKGSARAFEARVHAVRGSGAKPDHPDLSSEPPQVPPGQLRILVELAPPPLSGPEAAATAAAFCDVGRTADVRFDRSVAGDLRLFGLALPWAATAAPAGDALADAR